MVGEGKGSQVNKSEQVPRGGSGHMGTPCE